MPDVTGRNAPHPAAVEEPARENNLAGDCEPSRAPVDNAFRASLRDSGFLQPGHAVWHDGGVEHNGESR